MRIAFPATAVAALMSTAVNSVQVLLGTDANMSGAGWELLLSKQWDVLGPFPIHAREQYFLTPGFPLNLSSPYEHEPNRSWPSSYVDNGQAGWTAAHSDAQGNLEVSFPNVRWNSLRSTEGWAALQHHAVLRTTLTLQPRVPFMKASVTPRLLVDLQRGSFFTLIPPAGLQNGSLPFVPEWHAGNIYAMERSLPSTIELPVPPFLDRPTTYDLFVSGDYEIRLFGDPRESGRETPTLSINLFVAMESKPEKVVREASHDVTCDFVDGFAFGDALGVGLRSVDGWWTVEELVLPNDLPFGIDISLRSKPRIAPSQTRIVPIEITQATKFWGDSLVFAVSLSSTVPGNAMARLLINVTLSVHHVSQWSEDSYETVKASYFYAQTHATSFLAKPPIKVNYGTAKPAILALHGAGVDILTSPFWPNSISRQNHSWIIMPTGRTAWGLDWHGPSASDAWGTVAALSEILTGRTSWKPYQLHDNGRVIVMGHSNGGQGAWYMASRYPDKVLAVIAAAGYLKAQQYVPLTLSRAGHFIDPSLRAILESSLIPDDNDLFLSNVADMPVLAIHGGDDTNVPTWHTREYVNVIRTWNNDANITYREDFGKPHWYPEIFQLEDVQAFLDSVLVSNSTFDLARPFTLTVAHPADSGALHGWRIQSLRTPGRLSRLHVSSQKDRVHIRTVNVGRLTFDSGSFRGGVDVDIDGDRIFAVAEDELVTFVSSEDKKWRRELSEMPAATASGAGRLTNILNSSAPLTVIVSNITSQPKALSIALRLAHNLDTYHKLDVEIISDDEAVLRITEKTLLSGNFVVLGGAENAFSRWCLGLNRTEFRLQGGIFYFKGRALIEESLGMLFTHPHPADENSMGLFLSANDDEGLERAFRLFPLRTGVPVPDWVLVGKDSDQVGAAGIQGAGVWNDAWRWNEAMSWLP